MLKVVSDHKQEKHIFMKRKGSPTAEFNHEKWACEFVFVSDISAHFNELDIRLQGKDLFINSIFNHVKVFEIKLPS